MAKKVEQAEKDKSMDIDITQQAATDIKEPVIEKIISTEHIPSHIDRILKNNSQYEFLYIDSSEGCFTPDTPQNIRGNAPHYKNPYHKQ